MSSAAATKLCKHCRHFVNDSMLRSPKFGKCRLTRSDTAGRIHPVDGRVVAPTVSHSYASTERSKWGACGEAGLRYEREPDGLQALRNAYAAPALGAAKGALLVAAWVGCVAVVVLGGVKGGV
jgi:hypothetical protein